MASYNESKLYYFLQLKEDFFDEDVMDYIASLPHGSEYICIYMRLCLRTINQNGILASLMGPTRMIEYDVNKISRLLNGVYHEDIIEKALNLFQELGLICEMQSDDPLTNGVKQLVRVPDMLMTRTGSAILKAKKKKALGLEQSAALPAPEEEKPKKKRTKKKEEEKKEEEPKIHYADNVTLTEREYNKLLSGYGEKQTAEIIDKLHWHKLAKGTTYKSDYAAIHTWVLKAVNAKPLTETAKPTVTPTTPADEIDWAAYAQD